MTDDIIIAGEDEDPAVIIAWLNGDEGEEWWSRNRSRSSPIEPGPPPRDQRIGDVSEDPTGRPPDKGPAQIAATEGAA